MEPLNTISTGSSFKAFSGRWVALALLLFVFAGTTRAQAQFDFSLSGSGPRNVVQGHDMYIMVYGQTLSGTGGNTTLSVQNAPAGSSHLWPDLAAACCGDGNDGSFFYGSATFATTLRLTASPTTPTGSHTILVTAVNNGVTRQLPYTFNVLAPPAPPVPPAIGSMPAIPNLSDWQTNMISYGEQVCNYLDTPGLTLDQRLGHVYYDQIRVMYQIADYVPASAYYWNACAAKARGVYRDEYVLPNNGGVPGYWNFTTGLRLDYERTGDAQSKNAALLLSQNGAIAFDSTPFNYLVDTSASRETAYAILAKLDTEKLGAATSPRLVSLVDLALGHLDQWFVSKTSRCRQGSCPAEATGQYYIQPFMVGITMRALIVYFEKTADPRIPPAIKTAADWLWTNAWISSSQAFWYENWVADPSHIFPAQTAANDLNLLIAPAYAWLYRQTGDAVYQGRGDQIFSGGVLGATTLGYGKQFDQNYIWSFDYVKWRTASGTGGASLDFSLSGSGPRNVVQGHDMYIMVYGQTLSGTGENTTLSVQNAPTGSSHSWPDLAAACCGDGNDGSFFYGSATFATTLRLTASPTTPTGSHTILVTAVNNGVTRQFPYTFNVLAPPAPPVLPAIGSMPVIPNLSDWQTNMISYGEQVCNYLDTPGLTLDQRLGQVYYDQIRVMYQIADYVPASASYWNACAAKARGVYRDEYVLPNNGGVPGYWNFTTGLRLDYERTGDAQSKNAALLLSQNGAVAFDSTPFSYLVDTSTSRETAYAILAKLDAEKLGAATSPRLVPLVDLALGHLDQWFVSKTSSCRQGSCPAEAIGQYYIQPFMVGLTMRALIVYFEKTADPRIPPAIKTAADWLWTNAWISSSQAFWYENWVADPSQIFPTQTAAHDLNLLIAPAYAWLYRQTGDAVYQGRGDQIFSGGVLGATTLGYGKQFDQNYIWSFDYVKWRTASGTAAGE